ncbi:MAG: DUF3810 family protein, partial [Oscillospiraceae bacterium]|nr:DUF3810 family protein [Oscillospiraceae bacterium]
MKTKVCVLLKSALRVLRRFYFLIPALAAIILYKVLPHLPRFTETVFSRFLFRIISFPIAIITSLIPISITELSLLLIPISMMVLLVFFIILMIRSESRLKTAGRAARAVGWVMSFTLLLYMLLHGANYYRLPVSTLMHLDMSPKSADLLQSFCIDLAKSASSERATLKEDENGNTVLSNGLLKTLAQAGDGYKILDNRYPLLWGSVNRTKPAQLSYKWSYTGISGMYFPFFVEANVNI